MSSQTKDKITVLHIFSGDLWAGAEVMVFNLLNELKNKEELKIIALSLNKGILTDKLCGAGIDTHIIPETDNSFAGIFFKAIRLLKKKKIDIIHSHRYKENLFAFLLAKAMGVKRLITTMHGLSEPSLQMCSTSTLTSTFKVFGLKTKIDYFILNHFFTHVVAVSNEMKKVLVEKYCFNSDKVEVIYNGIPLPTLNLNLNLDLPLDLDPKSNGSFHIGTVGRMVPVKDFNLFLEIAAEIKKQVNSQSAIRNPKFDNVHFSILGDGPLKEQLTEKVKELNIQDCVEFISPIPDPMPYYQSLDLYLNTSVHEGIPLSILEAMACGKTVVAPKVGGIPEIISDGENGVLIEAREPKKIADSCLKLMQDKGMRLTMADKASKRIAAYFSNLKMAEGYQKLYSFV